MTPFVVDDFPLRLPTAAADARASGTKVIKPMYRLLYLPVWSALNGIQHPPMHRLCRRMRPIDLRFLLLLQAWIVKRVTDRSLPFTTMADISRSIEHDGSNLSALVHVYVRTTNHDSVVAAANKCDMLTSTYLELLLMSVCNWEQHVWFQKKGLSVWDSYVYYTGDVISPP